MLPGEDPSIPGYYHSTGLTYRGYKQELCEKSFRRELHHVLTKSPFVRYSPVSPYLPSLLGGP
jgi:hypothetical protein